MNTEQQLREGCIKQLREKIKPLNWYLPYAQLEEKIISAMIDFLKQELSRLGEIYVEVPLSSRELPPSNEMVYLKGYKRLDKGFIRKGTLSGKESVAIWEQYSKLSEWQITHEELNHIYWLKKLSLEEKIIEPADVQSQPPVVSLTASSGNSIEQRIDSVLDWLESPTESDVKEAKKELIQLKQSL